MQVLFPELTVLELHSNGKWMPVLPDSFLGGSASHLQSLTLKAIPFPGLPKLLLSATNLAHLFLFDIPHSGYFTPEAMVTALYTLTGFQLLLLQFQSSLSRPDRPSQRPPPSTRSVLPVLAYFFFSGVPEYLDDIVAGMDTPRLDHLSINLFNQIELDTPQFVQFISRAPTFGAFKGARLFFKNDHARVELFSQTPVSGGLHLDILCRDVGWQMSSLGQVFTSCLPPLSTLEDLYIVDALTSARQHREYAMAGTITSICLCDEPLLIPKSCTMYCACPARTRWGQNDGSVAQSAEYFLRASAMAMGCPGRHRMNAMKRLPVWPSRAKVQRLSSMRTPTSNSPA